METILIATNIVLAIVLIILVLLQRSEGGALGLGLSQDNFASTRSVGNFLTKSTAIIASFVYYLKYFTCRYVKRKILWKRNQLLEKIEEEKDSETPKIPESSK